MQQNNTLKPMPLWQSLLMSLAPGAMIFIATFVVARRFLEATGHPFLVGYLIAWGGSEVVIFLASLAAYLLEGNPLNWRAFTSRYRLHKMTGKDWLWAAAMLLMIFVASFGLSFTAEWIAHIPGLAVPDFLPPEAVPGRLETLTPSEFMGMTLRGQWWVAVAFFVGWFCNIFGEEFWYRGFIFPRQELTHGRYTWIIHGLLFGFFHFPQWWNLPWIVPVSLFGAYAIQKRKNTWIQIIAHGLANMSLLIVVIVGVIGQ